MNPNYEEMQRLLRTMGGRVTCARAGGRHFIVYFITPNGNKAKMTLWKSKMQAGHLKFYLRRTIRQADNERG
jgi:hypothetical protein